MTSSPPPTVLVTGASGFVGSRVVEQALRAVEARRLRLRLMAHRRPLVPQGPGVENVTGDLTRSETLRGLCDGVDVLVHCASHIGGPDELCRAVNVAGTGALLHEARRAGVTRIVYLSTAAVYGRGRFVRAEAADLERAPLSETSRTRATAEDLVRAAGGYVLRPHLVYGAGDRWVVPALLRLLKALGAHVREWERALLSVVDVGALAGALIATALAPEGRLRATVHHANHPDPVRAGDLVRAAADACGAPWPAEGVNYTEACERLTARGVPTHTLDMLVSHHWFGSTALWEELGRPPGRPFAEGFAEHAAWYRSQYQAAGRAT
ncbi:NAD-dependent epimerase/dehydratase family protein [Streptomyces sudanensis]|uniref:NAD-dependent epimerase/dehydratase family protein n=1 Tax=Streptomyces sudanensis TaxID=436397 RepID=UPI0020CF227C|nr:NAD-dependent epimerase/dehydratase family protein [Streptomyces sudanensis]MCQ0000835.1 NAD-dependent epimerase/dehydratase family protein [Streptomyces sudanensis]